MTTASRWPDGSWSLAAADVLRAASLLSFAFAAVAMGGVAAALFALVLLGVTLPRVVRLPPVLDAFLCAALLGAAWSALLDWYVAHSWLDLVAHAAVTGLVAVTVYVVLARIGALHYPDDPTLTHPLAGAVVSVAFLGLGLGVLWELGEWYGQTYLDPRIQTGYADTIGDLAVGGAGALIAGSTLLRTVFRDDREAGRRRTSPRTRRVPGGRPGGQPGGRPGGKSVDHHAD